METKELIMQDPPVEREMATYRFVYVDMGMPEPTLILQYYPEIDQINLVDLYS